MYSRGNFIEHDDKQITITISGWNVWTFNFMNQPIKIFKEVSKVVKPTNNKTLHKILGASAV